MAPEAAAFCAGEQDPLLFSHRRDMRLSDRNGFVVVLGLIGFWRCLVAIRLIRLAPTTGTPPSRGWVLLVAIGGGVRSAIGLSGSLALLIAIVLIGRLIALFPAGLFLGGRFVFRLRIVMTLGVMALGIVPIALAGLTVLLRLFTGRLHRFHHAEIMLGMLQQTFGANAVPGGRGISGKSLIFIVNLSCCTPNLDLWTSRIK